MDTDNLYPSASDSSFLFISYAWEDSIFADWLEKKLTHFGYLVWRDKTSLHGGERWTKEIEHALDNLSFRVLGLLSNHSINKDNPVKERTKAIQVGKRKGISDFLVTINVDGLKDLDWQTIDINYIDFSNGWALGLEKLLKTLEIVNAPKNNEETQQTINTWISQLNIAERVRETIHMNALQFDKTPDKLYKLSFEEPLDTTSLGQWVSNKQNELVYWCFELPSVNDQISFEIEEITWREKEFYDNMRLSNIVKNLIYSSLKCRLIEKGLVFDDKHKAFIFKDSSTSNGRIYYKGSRGRNISIKIVGERNFSSGTFIYNLAFSCSICMDFEKSITLVITPTYVFYEPSGIPLAPRKVISRRKKMCRSLYNHQWLIRLYAIVQWLNDKECLSLNLDPGQPNKLVLSDRLLEYSIDVGISSDYRSLDCEVADLPVDSSTEDL